jgi:hypothetical protein
MMDCGHIVCCFYLHFLWHERVPGPFGLRDGAVLTAHQGQWPLIKRDGFLRRGQLARRLKFCERVTSSSFSASSTRLRL